MTILFGAMLLLVGLVIGLIVGRNYEQAMRKARQDHERTKQQEPADPKWIMQYQNFLNYNGTGKGQQKLEN